MDEGQDFSLCGEAVVTETDLRDDYYWKLVADFVGAQSGEGLDLDQGSCRNRVLIQVGLLREDNNFPWLAVIEWLKKLFPAHQSADFRCLIERGTATTLSLGSDARRSFLDQDVNFDFVGPICDSIGVERQHLLELRDFSERARLLEVTNGLMLELSGFVAREKISPVVLVRWLRNFDAGFCTNGDFQKAYKLLKPRIKKIKLYCRNQETRSHRRNAAMEHLLAMPFELLQQRKEKVVVKKRPRRDMAYERVRVKQEPESCEIQPPDEADEADADAAAASRDEASADKAEPLTLLDIAMLSLQKLASVYGGRTAACSQVAQDLLRNHYALMCREHPAMAEFGEKLAEVQRDMALASPVVFLNAIAGFLVEVGEAVEQQLRAVEDEIVRATGERLGRDKLPEFQGFVSMAESATARYVHMACDMLSPRSATTNSYRRHWLAFCEEKGNPSRLAANQSNRFINYFEAAAGLTHHHQEVALFVSDLLAMSNDRCPNVVLQSLDADANDPVIQSLVCVLALVYVKVLGPFWQLLKSGGEYALFPRYLLHLHQRFLDWAKDPAALLEPEGDAANANVFLQFPLQERTFHGVFHYCGRWHANRDLIRACLAQTVRAIAAAAEEHLMAFLPGGAFAQTLPTEVSLRLVSCTFSVLMAEYPFGHSYPYNQRRPDKLAPAAAAGNPSSESSGGEQSGEEQSSEELSPGRRRAVLAQVVEDTDRDYVVAAVDRNGGPCKSQQDLDKMLLRFEEMSRAERSEMIRCEILYQKLVLNNPSPQLDEALLTNANMLLKLRLALPRVKPGYSLVLEPWKTKTKPKPKPKPKAKAAAAAPGSQGEAPAPALLS
ncbi:uncharacterized protein LOC133460617 [Cololabis saira]|uniref:uncharacterized protein LOC133460617 n=1 Tax=Cololabis saira TaxID=129043 RepID=UPI002AD3F99C|nr:uncharacterized protein LOC133460617 [Cololabis saira]XP_061597269.1 uncharacterized protein LOC133460617 [Cololabis saira]XP_061597270.1 uncharacterized protein LOC133460617 [Cololabis saira]